MNKYKLFEKVNTYKLFEQVLNINHKDIKFPIDLKGIKAFHNLNKDKIEFNVYEIDCDVKNNKEKIKMKNILFRIKI